MTEEGFSVRRSNVTARDLIQIDATARAHSCRLPCAGTKVARIRNERLASKRGPNNFATHVRVKYENQFSRHYFLPTLCYLNRDDEIGLLAINSNNLFTERAL